MFLGIDCGTQGTKALCIDDQGRVVGRGYAHHEIIEREDGAREQHPSWWIAAATHAVNEALRDLDRDRVVAIGVSGQQHGCVLLDAAGEVVRPAKLWCDTQTAPENASIVTHFGGPVLWAERFGIIPLTGYTVSKLLWTKRHAPGDFAKVHHVLLPHDYLNYWLTGEFVTEAGDASGTGYFDPRRRAWLPEVLAAIDEGTGQLERALPRVIDVREPAGTLSSHAAAALGLSTKVLVSAGGGDNMMGAIGTGNVRPGVVTLSLGTSSTVYSWQPHPLRSSDGTVAPFCASSVSETGPGWLPLVCTMNCTNVVTQTVEMLGLKVAGIEAALGSTKPGSDGLILLPFLNGERTPDLPTARGTLSGMSANNLTRDNLIRATVEGVSFGILNGLDSICSPERPHSLRIIGGGSRSAAWRQLLADASGVPVEAPAEEEAGCLGAAIQAMYAHSIHMGSPESFESLAMRIVHTDPQRTAHPVCSEKSLYEAARNRYNATLKRFYLTF